MLVRCWGDQCVAYDTRSGDTHLLNALAGHALLCLAQGIETFDALAQCVAGTMEAEADAAFEANLRQILGDLQRVHLPCCLVS